MRRILVTGSRGFVGKYLVPALQQQGCTVYEMDRVIGHDVSDLSTFQSFYKENIEVVIHLAGLTYVPTSWDDPTLYYRVNTFGTQNVLDFCKHNHSSLINVSSYLYGIPKYQPIDEQHPVNPNNPYAHSKLLAEHLCDFYRDHFGIKVITVRPFNFYGLGQDRRFLIPLICTQVTQEKCVRLENLTPRRDFLHVKDFVDLCMVLLKYDGKEFLFNAGSGMSYSPREILHIIEKIIGRTIHVEEKGSNRVNEIPETLANCALAREKLSWTPKISMDDGLREILEYYKEVGNGY